MPGTGVKIFIYIWCEPNSVIIFGSLEMLLGQNQYFLFLKQVSYKKNLLRHFIFLLPPKIWLSYATVCFQNWVLIFVFFTASIWLQHPNGCYQHPRFPDSRYWIPEGYSRYCALRARTSRPKIAIAKLCTRTNIAIAKLWTRTNIDTSQLNFPTGVLKDLFLPHRCMCLYSFSLSKNI